VIQRVTTHLQNYKAIDFCYVDREVNMTR
jgi:hypothetical protein